MTSKIKRTFAINLKKSYHTVFQTSRHCSTNFQHLNMKKTFLCTLCSLFCCMLAAQITLQKIGSTQQKKIAAGSNIKIKLPTPTARPDCDCYQIYRGELLSTLQDSISIVVTSEERQYTDPRGRTSKVNTKYGYGQQRVATTVPIQEAYSITKVRASKGWRNAGGLLMFFSGVHALFVGPALPQKSRALSDKIALGTFGAGLAMTFLPSNKTYTLRQKEGSKRRAKWRIAAQ
jgi:hypothetical protein